MQETCYAMDLVSLLTESLLIFTLRIISQNGRLHYYQQCKQACITEAQPAAVGRELLRDLMNSQNYAHFCLIMPVIVTELELVLLTITNVGKNRG